MTGIAREMVHRHEQRQEERRRGMAVNGGLTMGSHRSADTLIPHVAKLPVAIASSAAPLQNATGAFLFLPGYSMTGGPDVGS